MRSYRGRAAALAGAAIAASVAHAEVTIREHLSDDTLLVLGSHGFDGGRTLDLTVGIGSGAFRAAGDPPNTIWTVGDRGPNFTCGEAKNVAGVAFPACAEVAGGRIYPLPGYAPSIHRVMILDDGLPCHRRHHAQGPRRPSPQRHAQPAGGCDHRAPLDGEGRRLSRDVHGIDAEGIVRLADGTFWITDENGPSLMHFSADGRMILRHVPRWHRGRLCRGALRREGNAAGDSRQAAGQPRHRELAISPDERFLYFIMQNPLANPDAAAYRAARNSRLFKIERATMRVAGEYVYVLDDPRSFRRDPSTVNSDPRISEMMAVGLDRFIVLERTEQTTKLYEVELAAATDITGSRWDAPATRPTLEQSDAAVVGIVPVKKTLRFDSFDFPTIVGKTEGMALLGDGALALINDDDFGIAGGRTQIVVVRGTGIAPR